MSNEVERVNGSAGEVGQLVGEQVVVQGHLNRHFRLDGVDDHHYDDNGHCKDTIAAVDDDMYLFVIVDDEMVRGTSSQPSLFLLLFKKYPEKTEKLENFPKKFKICFFKAKISTLVLADWMVQHCLIVPLLQNTAFLISTLEKSRKLTAQYMEPVTRHPAFIILYNFVF